MMLSSSSHTALTFCSLQKKKNPIGSYMKRKKGNISTRGRFSLFMSFVELNHDVCFCGLCPLVIALLSVLPNVVCTVSAFLRLIKLKLWSALKASRSW